MKVLKTISILLFTILTNSFVFGQNSSFKTISEQARDQYYERMKDYDSGILVADSLLEAYKTEQFNITSSDGTGSYSIGSGFIRNCYARLHNLDLSETYCLDKVAEVDQIIELENQTEADRLYQKIVDKANKHFDANDFPKAIELYERALKFRPDDTDVQAKLELAKSKLN